MTPIREAAEELADLPLGHTHRHGLGSDDLPLEGKSSACLDPNVQQTHTNTDPACPG